MTPDYFSTLGMTLASGRLLTDRDAVSGSAVLVNQAFERRYLPRGAVGQRLRVSNSDRTFAIVGVVSDIREFGPANPPRPTAYWAFGNGPYPGMIDLTVMLRVADRRPLSVIPAARASLAAEDPFIALDDPITLEELALNRAGRDRLAARTLLLLGSAMAVALTGLGVYGVIAFSVAVRRREIGIRRALGCTSQQVVTLFVRQGVTYAMPGVALGLLMAHAATRGVASYLYEVTPGDPVTFAVTSLGVGLLAAVASWLPARRAAATDASLTLLRE